MSRCWKIFHIRYPQDTAGCLAESEQVAGIPLSGEAGLLREATFGVWWPAGKSFARARDNSGYGL
jgi:hypothetical protein